MIIKEPTLLTRGDTPVDKQWVQAALRTRYGIRIYEYNRISNATSVKSFKGGGAATIDHRIDQGDRARSSILRASRHLQVNYPGSEGKLKRDYFIVENADSMYFVGEFSESGNSRLQLKGDISWMAEMFFDKLIAENKAARRFPIYMYCTQINQHGQLNRRNRQGGTWCQLTLGEDPKNMSEKIYNWVKIGLPPKPTGYFIGVGGNQLTEDVKGELSTLLI